MTSHLTHHFPGCGTPFASTSVRLVLVALAASLALVGCTAPSGSNPEAAGYFPYYGRGIDQDVAIGHDSTQPLASTLHLHNTQPWQLNH